MITDIFRNLIASLRNDILQEIKNAVKKHKEPIVLKRPIKLIAERDDITELTPSVKKVELNELGLLKFWIGDDVEDDRPCGQHIITDIEILLEILDQCLNEVQ